MRVITNRNEVLPALDLARRVAERGDGILSSAQLIVDDAGLHVAATDYDVAATAIVEASTLAAGNCRVQAAQLFSVVAALPAGVDVELAIEGSRLAVLWKKRRSLLPTLDAEFPIIDDDVDASAAATLPAAALREMLQLAIPMASEDSTRPSICGVSLRFDGGDLVATSTDGKRVAQLRRACGKPGSGERMISKRAASLITRICGDGDAAVGFGARWAGVSVGALRVVGRTGDDTFPDTSRAIPIRGGFEVSTAALDDALAAAGAIGAEAVKLSPDGMRMSISADGFDDTVDTVDACSLPVGGVGMSVRYLREALAACRAESVEVTGNDNMGPYRFDAAGDTTSDDFFVVMPYRL